MNNFCRCLRNSLFRKFHIEAEVFVSKKKGQFVLPLIALLYRMVFSMKWSVY